MNNSYNYDQALIEGRDQDIHPLALKLSDDELAFRIGNRIEDGKRFWNREYDLDSVRVNNYKYWRNTKYLDSNLYEYQNKFGDPVSAVAIETLLPMVLANPPQPIVSIADTSDSAQEMADNLQNVLLSKYEDLYIKGKYLKSARHLLQGQRFGLLKLGWDDTIGSLMPDGNRSGDIKVMSVHPKKIVIDAEASDPENIPLIAEYQKKSLEEWGMMFPQKKDMMMRQYGISSGVSVNLSASIGVYETHFTDYTNGTRVEAIAWKYEQTFLGSMKTPFWNYEEVTADEQGNLLPTNFLEKPKKPYILINHLNSSDYVIDDSSLVELAQNQQDILNKRGRQIVDNADQANSGLIFNTKMITPDEMDKLIGNPSERIGVSGDVREAMMRIPPPLLPDYVFIDKQDSRARINDIFGTNAPIRGQETSSKTLGQEVLSQRSDMSRTMTLATSIEDSGDQLYKMMVQIMKVFYDSPREIPFTTQDGQKTKILFSSKGIKAGMSVKVKSGSVLPDDPVTKATQATQLAGVLDPYTLADMAGLENPREVARRIFYFKLMPDRYLSDVLQVDPEANNVDQSAVQEYQQLLQGVDVPPQQNPSKAHLNTHNGQLNDPKFKQTPPDFQAKFSEHVKAEIENSKMSMGQENEQQGQEMPMDSDLPPEENEAEPPQSGGLLSRLFSR